MFVSIVRRGGRDARGPSKEVLECGDLSPLLSVATCRDAAGDRSPATKAPTGRRTPKPFSVGLKSDE